MMDYEGGFLAVAPFWLVVDRRSLSADGSIEDLNGIQSAMANGQRYVLVFTDEDLAQQYKEWKDKLNLFAMRMPDHPTLVAFLVEFEKDGYAGVMFDLAQSGGQPRIVRMEAALRKLRCPPRKGSSDG